MDRGRIALVAALGLAGVAAVTWAGGGFRHLTDSSRGAIGSCEEEIKEGLASPSSFRLIWSDYTPRPPMSVEESQEISRAAEQCEPTCTTGQEITRAFTEYIDRMGPVLARRLKRGDKLSDEDRRHAELWITVQQGITERRAKIAKNLPEDQSAFVTLEYDADNSFGATLREFAMCRFGAIGTDGRFERSDIVQSGPVDDAAGQDAKEIAERLGRQ